MKRESLIAAVVIMSCFIAGIFLSDYIRSKQHLDKISSAQLSSGAQASNQDLLEKPSPDFSLMDALGQRRNSSEWKGKVLAINFWATWCPPCLKEIPHFIKLQEKYGHQGLQFVGISMEAADEANGFADLLGINYPLLVGEQEVIKLAGKLGNQVGGLPYTVILDRNGHISFIKMGPLSASEAEQVITSLL